MKENNVKISVIGLGYVGLPLAVEFSKYFPVIGYDLSSDRIEQLKKGFDKTKELSKDEITSCGNLHFVHDPEEIQDSNN